MKKLLIMASLAILCSCNKQETKPTQKTSSDDVIFRFNTDGNTSDISVTNNQTNKINTYSNVSSTFDVKATAKIGDKFILEMKGLANGLDKNYNITVLVNGKIIAIDGVNGTASIQDQDIFFPMNFSSISFQ